MSKGYQAIIFDLDNTLIDFQASEDYGLQFVHSRFFDGACDFDTLQSAYEPINTALWRDVASGKYTPAQVARLRFKQLGEHFSISLDEEEACSIYESRISDQVFWYEGTEKVFRQLASHYPVAIVTNGLTVAQKRKIAHMNIDDCVRCVVISEEVGLAKPDPRIFNQVFSSLGCAPESCLMVGDSFLSDYQGAMNVGMDFCWVKHTAERLPAHLSSPRFAVDNVSEMGSFLLEQSINL